MAAKYRQSWTLLQANCGRSIEMERTGGEPDVVCYDTKTRANIFFMIARWKVP